VISIAGESFACSEHLSPRIEAVVPEVVDYIRNHVGVAA
jgi:hypothetical protein